MSCVLVKTNFVNIDSTVRKIYFAIRSGLDCGCSDPVGQLSGITLEIKRKGVDNASVITYNAFDIDAEGNVSFYIDSLVYNLPNGLYSATVLKNNVACKPYYTIRIGKPCRISGAYAVSAGNSFGDENPS